MPSMMCHLWCLICDIYHMSWILRHFSPTSNTIEYHRIPSNTIEHPRILLNTIEYRRIPSNAVEYRWIPLNTARAPARPPPGGWRVEDNPTLWPKLSPNNILSQPSYKPPRVFTSFLCPNCPQVAFFLNQAIKHHVFLRVFWAKAIKHHAFLRVFYAQAIPNCD